MRVLLLFLCLLLTSCETTRVVIKQDENISTGIYAARDSLYAGRIDLTKKYLDETVKIVTPPKKRIKVYPLYKEIASKPEEKKKVPVVVLPDIFRDFHVVIEDSKEYKELLAKSRELEIQYEASKKDLENFAKAVELQRIKDEETKQLLIQDNEKLKNDVIKYKEYFTFYWTIVVFLILGIVIYIVYLIAKFTKVLPWV